MKSTTATVTQAGSEFATLFQTAARLEIPAERLVAQPAPAITGETFASLRSEAEISSRAPASPGRWNRGAITRLPVSFDTVRLAVFIHILKPTA